MNSFLSLPPTTTQIVSSTDSPGADHCSEPVMEVTVDQHSHHCQTPITHKDKQMVRFHDGRHFFKGNLFKNVRSHNQHYAHACS